MRDDRLPFWRLDDALITAAALLAAVLATLGVI